jgi:hypothetical protein
MSDEAIHLSETSAGLLRFARDDGFESRTNNNKGTLS